MEKRNVIIVLILLLSLCIIFIGVDKLSSKEEKNNNSKIDIAELKYSKGATADDSLYEIKKDLDGRDTLVIKQELLYKVALAGILNENKPTFENLDQTIKCQNLHSGIWISDKSRQMVLSLINEHLQDKYIINEEGYLLLEEKTKNSNSYDMNLQKSMQNNKTYIIAVLGQIYEIDNMTGQIQLYPFEQIDQYQLCEPIEYEDKKIIVLSTNKQKKLSEQELLEAMIEQMIM